MIVRKELSAKAFSFGRFLLLVVFFLMVLGLFSSCGGSSRGTLRREDLFTISLGTLPGELDWFYRDAYQMAGTADVDTRDGLLFLSGGNTGRVMIYNSYGDLLNYVYDAARNPEPERLEDSEQQLRTWAFRNPRLISAEEGGFLVVDRIEVDRSLRDADTGSDLNHVVLRFDRNGENLGYLGREGMGGTPFPHIESLNVRNDGGIVVGCRTGTGWISYWFDSTGRSTATVRIDEDQLPGLDEAHRVAVYSIKPDPVHWELHLRVDLFQNPSLGIDPEARLYTFSLDSMEYQEALGLVFTGDSGNQRLPSVPPEHLGTTTLGIHVFLAPLDSNTYELTALDREGRVIEKRTIVIPPNSVVYRVFKMENNGLVSGLFLGDENATFSWWRGDRILGVDSES